MHWEILENFAEALSSFREKFLKKLGETLDKIYKNNFKTYKEILKTFYRKFSKNSQKNLNFFEQNVWN